MAKETYLVKVIREGREKDYFDFWRKGAQKNAAGEVLEPALVGFEVEQDGRDLQEAVAQVRRKHPGLQIDTQGTRLRDDGDHAHGR